MERSVKINYHFIYRSNKGTKSGGRAGLTTGEQRFFELD